MSMYDKSISEEKKASLEFAEDAREVDWHHPSFALSLFQGRLDYSLISPFPIQSDEERLLGDQHVKRFKEFLIENLDPDEVDRTSIIPEHVMKGLGELGGFAIKISEEYGGLGLSQVNYNRIMSMVASYCASTGVLLSAHQSIGVPQPLKKKKFLPMFAKGVVSAFALTEPDVGSDPRSMSTTATPTEDGKHYILNGTKLWCTNGVVAGVIVVMAVTPPKMVKGKERKQITALIVETDSPGFEIIHRCHFMGLHGIQNGLLKFENVKVPRENVILGEGEGLKLALTTLNTGRLTLPAGSLGAGKWCLHVARKWSQERSQWGAKIGEHESVAEKLSYIASHTYAMDAITWLTSGMADDKTRDIRLEAAIAKLFCTEHSWKIVDETLQIRGGQGYESADSLKARGMHPWAVERVMRDIRINLIIEGTSEIMNLFIAREALDPHLSKIKPMLMGKSLGEKFSAFLKMSMHYATWYPKLYLPSMSSFDELDSSLANHLRFVQSSSKKLARTVFHQMMIHQKKMEGKQAVLNRLVGIGTELFAISTTCSYTDYLLKSDQNKENAIDLANHFCLMSRKRVSRLFEDGSFNCDKVTFDVAKKIMKDEFEWMESGIIT